MIFIPLPRFVAAKAPALLSENALGLSVASSGHIIRGFATLNVTEACAVQKADQPRNSDLDFFLTSLNLLNGRMGPSPNRQ
jgi:hypothetical protein